jgi:hypothetical protein
MVLIFEDTEEVDSNFIFFLRVLQQAGQRLPEAPPLKPSLVFKRTESYKMVFTRPSGMP